MITDAHFIEAVESRMASFLAGTEERLGFSTDNDVVWYVREYVNRKGKRMRPTLLLHAADTGSVPFPCLVDVAAATELLHVFALMHDDRIDDDERFTPASGARPYLKSYNSLRVLGGDYLYVLGMELLEQAVRDYSRPLQIVSLIRKISLITIAAQSDDVSYLCAPGLAPDVSRLYDLYDRKTGWYSFVAPMQIGYLLSLDPIPGTGDEHDNRLEELRKLGLLLGRKYQLSDDERDVKVALAAEGAEQSDIPHWEFNLLGTWLSDVTTDFDHSLLVRSDTRTDLLRSIDAHAFTEWCRARHGTLESEIEACTAHNVIPMYV